MIREQASPNESAPDMPAASRPARRKRASAPVVVEREYTADEAAELLGISRRTFYRKVDCGEIDQKTVHGTRCVTYPEGALRRYQLSKRVESPSLNETY